MEAVNELKRSENAKIGAQIQTNIRFVAESIKLSSTLPIGTARTNFIRCFPCFKDEVEPYSDQLLSMLSELLLKEGIRVNLKNYDTEEKVDLVVDGVNKILERVRDNLNELNGIKRNSAVSEPIKTSEKSFSGSWNRIGNKSARWKTTVAANYSKVSRCMNKILEKPQNKFEVKVDNSNMPFEPQLISKPNAVKPLAIYLEVSASGVSRYCHPYLHELNAFTIPMKQLKKVEPLRPTNFDSSHAVFVDDRKTLDKMLNELKNEIELAVDLEHHSYRSYQGLTCLLQISTRTMDFIIDALALRSELSVLNEIFTNPNVVKVFHDANSDVIWLQKDLNLYVVNMFDTHLASLTLNFPKLSLSYLLKEYCNVEADKRFQLFDWRTRPLPEEALTYARMDTHYLLYLYDRLRNALLEKSVDSTHLLKSVYSRGVSICKKRHEKLTGENDYLILYKQCKQTFDSRQTHALKSLYEWRDRIAREEDESTGYVLPNHMLLQIAEILPREMQGILACCNPVPFLVRKNLSHLHQLISVSRSQFTNKCTIPEDSHLSTLNKKLGFSKLRCPHDFSHHDDFRDNLATLFNGSDVINVSCIKQIPAISVFDDEEWKIDCQSGFNSTVIKFVSPFERYKRTIMFLLNTLDLKNETKNENDDVGAAFSTARGISKKIVDESANSSQTKGKKRKQSAPAVQIRTKTQLINGMESSSVPSEIISNSELEQTKSENERITVAKISSNKLNKKCDYEQKDELSAVENKKVKFTPFDYSRANFSQFVTSGQKNMEKLLNASIKFGADKRKLKRRNFVKRGNRKL